MKKLATILPVEAIRICEQIAASQQPVTELVFVAQRLELRYPNLKSSIYIDFVNGAMGYRCQHSGHKELLARAIGLKNNLHLNVLDATAGLGRDGFVLASLGCRVLLIEQSPIISALLEDGLARASQASKTALAADRITLIQANSIDVMMKLSAQDLPEVVYLDPMYPERTKSALVKKEMRLLRTLIGNDKNTPLLLKIALDCAQQRVVVKRPRLAPAIEGPKPDFMLEGKNTRFDVYLTHKG
ncbi:SAM-dependent methyltransferase family protein [Candidatus Nitrosoglobus terrae]|uniref:Ribosomal RNA small subunit methyltransferase J n=1 Tax=Candidatus Nitrosoglobus terrae TaxID=1630141 RepID=A0A1Q2SK65_9GAMM|nr:class I SAM-dependent methyltransferase [Candidatus Nitrosoglobus terrae]BAW79507.1 SAM-dependent methyltransferase family protein [Candidatus Nitrosoglobus terrae]